MKQIQWSKIWSPASCCIYYKIITQFGPKL